LHGNELIAGFPQCLILRFDPRHEKEAVCPYPNMSSLCFFSDNTK
jgi:hypothetical protein